MKRSSFRCSGYQLQQKEGVGGGMARASCRWAMLNFFITIPAQNGPHYAGDRKHRGWDGQASSCTHQCLSSLGSSRYEIRSDIARFESRKQVE